MTIKKALTIALFFCASVVLAQGLSSNVAVINSTVPSGWSLLSLPVAPANTAIGMVFADTNGTGNQFHGGVNSTASDQIYGANGSAWYYSGNGRWYGALTVINNNAGYWINNKSGGARTIKLLGTVQTTPQQQSVLGGSSWTLVGVSFPKTYTLSDTSNGLIRSGFSGGTVITSSQVWDENAHFAYYLTSSSTWGGSLTQLVPGHAYYILNKGNTFVWTVNPPTSY